MRSRGQDPAFRLPKRDPVSKRKVARTAAAKVSAMAKRCVASPRANNSLSAADASDDDEFEDKLAVTAAASGSPPAVASAHKPADQPAVTPPS